MLLFAFAACGNQAGNAASSTPEPSNTENQQEPYLSNEPQSEGSDSSETDASDSKVLVAYFSSAGNIETDKDVRGNIGKGNTKVLAEMIQEQVNGDLFFIETVDKYPANYNDAIGAAMQELRNNTRPALASHVENIEEYDVIFLGYPNWWGTLPQAVLTFLEEYDFSGKTVILFCTYEDSGVGRSIKDLEKMLPNTTILKGFSVAEKDLEDSEEAVIQWLSELDLGNNETSDALVGKEKSLSDSVIAETSDDLTFPLGNAINAPSFTGTAYLSPMIANEEVYNFPQTNNVSFEPGARSNWHSPGGMIILVTGGVGYYQEEGHPAQIIRKGDVIECAPGVKHWHGATPDSWFSQMVVYDSHYVGGEGAEPEPVTDEYYANLKTEEYVGRVITNDNEFMFQRAEQSSTLETFNGPIFLSSVIGGENVAGAPGMHYVVFEPGVINNWHIHAGGQIMIATDGIGYHQIEGQPVEVLYPGDVAFCPPDVKHWHGGSANTRFAHIAVNTNPELSGVEWFDRISEEEYNQLTTEKAEG